MFIRIASIIVALLGILSLSVGQTPQPKERATSVSATISLRLDVDQIRKAGVDYVHVNDKATAILRRPRFKLSELQQLEFKNGDGKKFKLSDFGTVEVEFEQKVKE